MLAEEFLSGYECAGFGEIWLSEFSTRLRNNSLPFGYGGEGYNSYGQQFVSAMRVLNGNILSHCFFIYKFHQ